LIRHGIDVNCIGSLGRRALDILCQFYTKENLVDIVQIFLQHEMEVDDKEDWERNNNFYGLWSYWPTEEDYNDFKKCMHSLCQSDQKENLNEIIRLLIENCCVVTSYTLTCIAYEMRKERRNEIVQYIAGCCGKVRIEKEWIQHMTQGFF
jgi:hypothetical protein